MILHKRVIVHARSSLNTALVHVVEMAGSPGECLRQLVQLAKKAIAPNPKPEDFYRYYVMVLAACVEFELDNTECLTEGQGQTWINDKPTSERGKDALKSCRFTQKKVTDELIVLSFDAGKPSEEIVQIQKSLLKWLLEQALCGPAGDDCLFVFGKFMFRQLGPRQEQMFVDLVREVTMFPHCLENEIRNMFMWLSGDNSSLRGKFGERIRQVLSVSWQHKLAVADSVHLVGVYDSVGKCSKCAWPAVEIFANRIRLLECEAKRFVEAVVADQDVLMPIGTVSFVYGYEATSLVLVIETATSYPPNTEDAIVTKLRAFWKKWNWNTGTHERVPMEVKIGSSLFDLNTGKRKK